MYLVNFIEFQMERPKRALAKLKVSIFYTQSYERKG